MRISKRLRGVVLVGLLGCLALGCKKEEPRPPTPTPAPTPQPAPPTLLGTLTLPSLDALDGAMAYADSIKPGTSAAMLAQVRRAIGHDGVRADAPVRFFILEPRGLSSSRPAMLLPIADEAQLRASATAEETIVVKDGYALIGTAASVDALSTHAFSVLGETAPRVPTATFDGEALARVATPYVGLVRQQMVAQVVKTGGEGAGKAMDLEVDGLVAMLRDSASIEVSLDASAARASVELTFVVRPGSAFATFIAAQQPFTQALLDRLPASGSQPPNLIALGHLEAANLRETLMPLVVEQLRAAVGPTVDEAVVRAIVDGFSGDFAMAGTLTHGGLAWTQLGGIDGDAAAVAERMRAAFGQFLTGKPVTVTTGALTSTITGVRDAGTHNGVTWLSYTTVTDVAGLGPEVPKPTRDFMAKPRIVLAAGWDDVIGVVTGDDATRMPALIDASRGKATRFAARGEFAALLADAAARKDSFACVVDVVGILGVSLPQAAGKRGESAALFSVGFSETRMRVTFTMPVAHAVEVRDAL